MQLGMTHPLVLSKVFGEFPVTEDNVLVQYEEIRTAIERHYEVESSDLRYIGVDVARFGADKTVFTELIGYKHTNTETLVKRDLTQVTGSLVNFINQYEGVKETIVCIDSTGLGAGVYDMLIENQSNGLIDKLIQIEEVHFGSGLKDDQDKARYSILKSKMFDKLSTDLRDHIDLMDESVYYEELPTIQYKFDSKGRIVIESKKDYKERTGKPSPDYSDSLALANYGRYVNIKYGSFKNHSASQPLVKQTKRRERKTGIKIKEY
jgi:hypothetical protein